MAMSKGGMRRAARVDKNQREIAAALRLIGATVQHLHTVGEGCPDLLVGFRGHCFVLEIKQPGKKQTPAQIDWAAKWNGQYALVHSIGEALAAIGAARTV